MRRYLQGTLDYACAVYAVVNALSCTHGIDLSRSRYIFQETLLRLSEHPSLWQAFLKNETDHYWLVRYLLDTWCGAVPWRYTRRQPFSNCLMSSGEENGLETACLYLPEREPPAGPFGPHAAAREAAEAWEALAHWFSGGLGSTASLLTGKRKRVSLIRFHRFLPGIEDPVISHWTTVSHLLNDTLVLHDASSEKQALFTLERGSLLHQGKDRPLLRIVPESILFLESCP